MYRQDSNWWSCLMLTETEHSCYCLLHLSFILNATLQIWVLNCLHWWFQFVMQLSIQFHCNFWNLTAIFDEFNFNFTLNSSIEHRLESMLPGWATNSFINPIHRTIFWGTISIYRLFVWKKYEKNIVIYKDPFSDVMSDILAESFPDLWCLCTYTILSYRSEYMSKTAF